MQLVRETSSARQLVRDKQKLADLSPGGSAERPIEVVSSSVIPVRAASMPCPLCEGKLRIVEETAESRDLRAVHMSGAQCGAPRVVWFVIRAPLAN